MVNLGKAFQGLAKGLGIGMELKIQDDRTKLAAEEVDIRRQQAEADIEARQEERYLRLIQKQLDEKKLKLEEQKIITEKKKMGLDVVQSLMGGEDMTPLQAENLKKTFQEQYEFDISPYIKQGEVNEKTGVVNTFRLENQESIMKAFDMENKIIERDINNIKAATAKIEARTALTKAQKGDDPKDAMDWFLNKSGVLKPGMTPEEQQNKVAEFANMTKAGMGFTVETTKEGTKITYGPKGSLPGNMESGTKLELEKNLSSLVDQAFALKEIDREAFKKHLTYGGKLQEATLEQLDKIKKEDLKPEQKLFLQSAWQLKSSVGRVFDSYRAEVTKSAAAVAELKMLEDRTLNMSMSKAVAEGALDYLNGRLTRLTRLKRLAIRQGINSDDVWSKFDEYVASPGDASLSKENIDARGDELEKLFTSTKQKLGEQVTVEQTRTFVTKQLKKEGYIK